MEKFDRKQVDRLASDLMLSLTDEEAETIVEKSSVFMEQIAALQRIDTKGVDMMSYPFDNVESWLREDEVTHVIDQSVAFKNAPKIKGDYFEIVQVVDKK